MPTFQLLFTMLLIFLLVKQILTPAAATAPLKEQAPAVISSTLPATVLFFSNEQPIHTTLGQHYAAMLRLHYLQEVDQEIITIAARIKMNEPGADVMEPTYQNDINAASSFLSDRVKYIGYLN